MQLLDALVYLHGHNIIHRDLKLSNLFLGSGLAVKVGDLGLAAALTHVDERKRTICGTPNYIAPEILAAASSKHAKPASSNSTGERACGGHSFPVDMWAVGVIVYTLLVGKPPFETTSVQSTYARIRAGEWAFPADAAPMSAAAQALIRACLAPRPEDRPTARELLKHAWFTADDALMPAGGRLSGNCARFDPTWRAGDLVPAAPAAQAIADAPLGQLLARAARASGTAERAIAQRQPSTHAENACVGQAKPAAGSSQPMHAPEAPVPRQALGTLTSNAAATRAIGQPGSKLVPSSVPAAHDARHGATLAALLGTQKENAGSSGSDVATHALKVAGAAGQHVRAPAAPAATTTTMAAPQLALPSTTVPDMGRLAITPGTQKATPARGTRATEGAAPHAELPRPPQQQQQQQQPDQPDTLQRLKHALAGPSLGAQAVAPVPPTFSAPPALLRATDYTVAPPAGAPPVWVVAWVDYTQRYGLGWMLNTGVCGVFFNDATKIALAQDGETFEYIERAPRGKDGKRVEPAPLRGLMSSPAPELAKKITLLKHFQGYLADKWGRRPRLAVEESGRAAAQAAAARAQGTRSTAAFSPDMGRLPYLKKWIRTRHAVLLRLSTSALQVDFHDDSRLVLAPECPLAMYVDKTGAGKWASTADAASVATAAPDLAKRIKYARDVVAQLIAPHDQGDAADTPLAP